MGNDDLFGKLSAQFGPGDVFEQGLSQMARCLHYYFSQLQEEGFSRQEALLLVAGWQQAIVALAKK